MAAPMLSGAPQTRPTAPKNASSGTTVAAPAIRLQNVSRIFGNTAVLRQISLELPVPSIAVLLGDNGAGKSTLLRLLAGLSQPSRGEVHIFGQPPSLVRHRIALVSHASMLYDELSATENLLYFRSLYISGHDCGCHGSPEMALRAVGLDPHLARPVAQYSQGMRQRLALARALQSDPDLLLLDEPFSNLDAAGTQQMLALLADFRGWPSPTSPAGRTIVLTTHQATLALPIADVVLQLTAGTMHVSQPGEGR